MPASVSLLPESDPELGSGRQDSLRGAVLAGPGASVTTQVADGPFAVVACPAAVKAALRAAGHADKQRGALTGAVTTVLVVGLCLYCGQGYPDVLTRLWPLLRCFNPATVMYDPVTSAALSQARARLPAGVLKALFEAAAAAAGVAQTTQRVFGLIVTAVDGTVFDLAATGSIRKRFATPSGGRFPQARVVTLVECATRRIKGAQVDSCGLSEQRLWDRLVAVMKPGQLNLADRNFFSMHRWRTAAGTGAHLIWRVKNGVNCLPATVIDTLPEGSQRVRLRESPGMLARRRKTSGDLKAAPLDDILARLVEFTVIVTDQAGRSTVSRFRVLTTLLDHEAYPAMAIAECYAERWQVELVYKTIKTTLRGGNRRLRGQSAQLAEQEIWGLLAVYNALVDQAVAAAVDVGVDPDEISFTAVLRATRDYLAPTKACSNCGHHTDRDPGELTAAILAGPRNRPERDRTSPRTQDDRQTQHTRNVTYTITIIESNLPIAT